MEIVQVKSKDVEKVAPLFNAYRMFYGQEDHLTKAERFLKERVTQRGSLIFSAVKEGKYIGFIQLFPSFSSVALKKAYILNDVIRCGISSETRCGRNFNDVK